MFAAFVLLVFTWEKRRLQILDSLIWRYGIANISHDQPGSIPLPLWIWQLPSQPLSESQRTVIDIYLRRGFPSSSDGKKFAYSAGDQGSIPGSERSPGEGNGNALQYSCLVNSRDRGIWQVKVHGVAKSCTRLSNSHFHFSFGKYVYSGPLPVYLFIWNFLFCTGA